MVSIHAFRGEGDRHRQPHKAKHRRFNPRLPGGRRQPDATSIQYRPACFNPRLPGGRRPGRGLLSYMTVGGFNPRLPGGRRLSNAQITGYTISSFNPRLPGGRRLRRSVLVCRGARFNPRLPGGRRRAKTHQDRDNLSVSIHAFRGEGDRSAVLSTDHRSRFQSTPSGGKATCQIDSNN